MKRREVIVGLGAAFGAAVGPLRVGAQAERTRRIGVLMSWTAGDPESLVRLAAFRDGLEKLGWREGHNLRLDVRWATSDTGLTQAFAKELVALQPDIILSPTTPTTTALLQHTRAIPVIFVAVSDPVGSGFVSKFSEPGSNVTGFINVEPTMAGKWLELLKEIAPRVERIAFLFNPATAPYAEYYLGPFKTAAASLRVQAVAVPVYDASTLESAIAALAREPNGGLVLMPDTFLLNYREESRPWRPATPFRPSTHFRQFAKVGGLRRSDPRRGWTIRLPAKNRRPILSTFRP